MVGMSRDMNTQVFMSKLMLITKLKIAIYAHVNGIVNTINAGFHNYILSTEYIYLQFKWLSLPIFII